MQKHDSTQPVVFDWEFSVKLHKDQYFAGTRAFSAEWCEPWFLVPLLAIRWSHIPPFGNNNWTTKHFSSIFYDYTEMTNDDSMEDEQSSHSRSTCWNWLVSRINWCGICCVFRFFVDLGTGLVSCNLKIVESDPHEDEHVDGWINSSYWTVRVICEAQVATAKNKSSFVQTFHCRLLFVSSAFWKIKKFQGVLDFSPNR